MGRWREMCQSKKSMEISLGCGTDLKVLPTVGVHSGPPRGLDKKKKKKEYGVVGYTCFNQSMLAG